MDNYFSFIKVLQFVFGKWHVEHVFDNSAHVYCQYAF